MLVLAVNSIDVMGTSYQFHAVGDSMIAGSTRTRNVGVVAGSAAAGALIGHAIGGGKGASSAGCSRITARPETTAGWSQGSCTWRDVVQIDPPSLARNLLAWARSSSPTAPVRRRSMASWIPRRASVLEQPQPENEKEIAGPPRTSPAASQAVA
jgi:hypothetical protein